MTIQVDFIPEIVLTETECISPTSFEEAIRKNLWDKAVQILDVKKLFQVNHDLRGKTNWKNFVYI